MIFGYLTRLPCSGHRFVPIQAPKTTLVSTWKQHRLYQGREFIPRWHTTKTFVASMRLADTILVVFRLE